MPAEEGEQRVVNVFRAAYAFRRSLPAFARAVQRHVQSLPGPHWFLFESATVFESGDEASVSRVVVKFKAQRRTVVVEVRDTGEQLSARTVLDRK